MGRMSLDLGFDVDLAVGLFKVTIAKWEALLDYADAIFNSKRTRVQARKLACLLGSIIYLN
jgi:hypothetical protein